ncbi:MAG TPA: TlpA disulfide reductase family protein [Phycisphaerales bacterium]|nr:TlpA disulfide reductase family protein [Phycisphaerales bacterium]
MSAIRASLLLTATFLPAIAFAPSVMAQAHEPDPAAKKAFADVVAAYRDLDSIRMNSTVTVGLQADAAQHTGSEVKLEGIYGKNRKARIKLRDFTCYVSDGSLQFINEKTPQSYFTMKDDGSPYYALMNAFVDIPFPELAIMLGEEDIDNVIMQLHPKAPWIQPTSVKSLDENGTAREEIDFTSDFEQLSMIVDPKTHLIQTIDLKVTGGDLVQNGTTLSYHHVYSYPDADKPVDAGTFRFDPENRQRVDTLVALMPRPVAPQGNDEAGGAEMEQPGELVGKPAPDFVVATLDGNAIDLKDLRGKVVVLDFWATWCPPCRQGLPHLQEVENWRRKENVDVLILPVNVWEVRDHAQDTPDQRKKQVKEFWEQQKFTMQVALDYSDDMAKEYGVSAIPRTIVIGPDGIVRNDHVGLVDTLKEEITAARTGKPQSQHDSKPE